jgi:rhodanese-related sulfurtransferase
VTLGELFDDARARIERLEPAAAHAAAAAGGLIVDIRSERSREHEGIVPGSLHVPRTVLEWRSEPGGSWRNPHLGDVERRVIVLCDQGYSSVFAAAMLAQLGYARACDVVGGFEAWRKAGLPVVAAQDRRDGGLPGMGDPDRSS